MWFHGKKGTGNDSLYILLLEIVFAVMLQTLFFVLQFVALLRALKLLFFVFRGITVGTLFLFSRLLWCCEHSFLCFMICNITVSFHVFVMFCAAGVRVFKPRFWQLLMWVMLHSFSGGRV